MKVRSFLYHDTSNLYEEWMLGIIISAMVYGGVLSLTLSYIPLLLKTSHNISRRMRNFLLGYVTFMLAISTVYTITAISFLSETFFGVITDPISYPNFSLVAYIFVNGFSGALCATLASWGADGFMLWRCMMLYQGVSPPRRRALIAVLILIGLSSLVCGLTFLIWGNIFILAITGITVFFNVVTATLITLRILYFERYIRKTIGLERDSPYTTTVLICVESSALIVIYGLIVIILTFENHGLYCMTQLMVHVYVVSPLLIVYRVALGKAATIEQRPSENGLVVSVLHFQSEPALQSCQSESSGNLNKV